MIGMDTLRQLAAQTPVKIPTGDGGNDWDTVKVPKVDATDATVVEFMNQVYMWAGIVAVIVIVIAGFFYVTSQGDSNAIQRAKNAILGAVVGLMVIMAAFLITQLVISFAS